ncbi:MAG: inositol monophosphatase family protein [Alphaproteobacteria bacterium]|nr:inositol monophosphatase family protein [Alphaproteobacteria bacterium]
MQTIRAFLNRLGDTVRPIHRRYFRSGVAVERKDDESPVTRSDREAEQALRREIANAFPEDGILGEEFGSERLDARRVWVLDPLDGTRAFVNGKPVFGVMAALLEEGRPVAGLIDMPILSERWIGIAGEPTTFNGAPARVRGCESLAAASLNATSPDIFPDNASLTAFDRLSAACGQRHFGGDCHLYGLLASGWIDLVAEAGLAPYDYLAHVAIVEGAGGRIGDWQGRPLGLESDGRVLAVGAPDLFEQALDRLGGPGDGSG